MILCNCTALRLPRIGLLSFGLVALCALPAWSQYVPERGNGPGDAGSAAVAPDGSVRVLTSTGRLSTISPEGIVTTQSYAVPDALPQAAREVLDQLARDEAEVRREARDKIEKARAETIEKLKPIQDQFTKAGQLDEAVAVRDAARRLQAGSGGIRYSAVHRLGDPNAIAASSDPGNLTAYRSKVGQSFYFDVTGATEGNVWGNVIYTDDSTLAAAAVHAGVLSPGQRGVVKVTILPGRGSYAGTESNGVTSQPYEQWPGSYSVEAPDLNRSAVLRLEAPRIPGGGGPGGGGPGDPGAPAGPPGAGPGYPDVAPGPPGAMPGYPPRVRHLRGGAPGNSPGEPGSGGPAFPPPVPGGSGGLPPGAGSDTSGGGAPAIAPSGSATGAGDLQQLRDRVGQTIEADLVGSTQGQVWGTDVYTDDSSPAAAAVHAGVLRDGETGHVRITILPGRDSYQGSDHNGVSSQPWKTWGGSFRVERTDKAPEEPRRSGAPR